jgi:hypothetical protein
MQIRPGQGVGPFLFGLTEAELIQALGPPDKRFRTDSEAVRLQYFGPRLEFSFDSDNRNCFGWIEVHNPEATLFGYKVVGEPIASVLPMVTAGLDEEPKHECFGSLETYFYQRNWVELQVDFGRVTCVNCGVLFDESDQPVWPVSDRRHQTP